MQDFTNPSVDGGDRNGVAERAMLARITAGTRLRAAREKLGPDLAHTSSLSVAVKTIWKP